MRTCWLTHLGTAWPRILLAGVLLGPIQGCGSKEGLLTSESRKELLGLLRQAGVQATFITDCWQNEQGFVLRVDRAPVREASVSDFPHIGRPVIVNTPSDLAQIMGPIVEKYVVDKKLRYKFVIVEIGQGRDPPSFKIQFDSTAPTAPPWKRFNGAHVSFDYPGEWRACDEESFARMKTALGSQGVELLAVMNPPGDGFAFSIARTPNPSSFERFYQDKKEAANRVTNRGVEVMGQRYAKYSVRRTLDLGDDGEVLLSRAEKPSGEIGISYQLLRDNYEYNINFIYPSKNAVDDASRFVRKHILKSFVILDDKAR